jgi:hypothetical protein
VLNFIVVAYLSYLVFQSLDIMMDAISGSIIFSFLLGFFCELFLAIPFQLLVCVQMLLALGQSIIQVLHITCNGLWLCVEGIFLLIVIFKLFDMTTMYCKKRKHLQAIVINHESVILKQNSEIFCLNSILADREGLILKLKEGNGKLQANLGVVNDRVIVLEKQIVANFENSKATNLSWQEKLDLSEICNAELKSVIDANHAVIDANHANLNILGLELVGL